MKRSFWDSFVNKDDQADQLHKAVAALPKSLKQPASEVAPQPVTETINAATMTAPPESPAQVITAPTLNVKGEVMPEEQGTGTVLMNEADMEEMLKPKAVEMPSSAPAAMETPGEHTYSADRVNQGLADQLRAQYKDTNNPYKYTRGEFAASASKGELFKKIYSSMAEVANPTNPDSVRMLEEEAGAHATVAWELMSEANTKETESMPKAEVDEPEAVALPDEPTIETVTAPTPPAEAVTAEAAGAKAKEANDQINDALEAFDKGEITEAELQDLQTKLEATIRKWAEKANKLEAESNEAAEALKAAALKLDEKTSELATHIEAGPAAALEDEAVTIELDTTATPEEKKRGGFLGAIARWYERGTRGGRRDRVNNKFAPVLAYAGREMDESADRGKKALRSAGLSVGSVAAAVVAPFAFLGLGGLLAGDALVRGVGTLRTTATGAAAGLLGGIGALGTTVGGATREALGRTLAASIGAARNVEEVQTLMREQNATHIDTRINDLEAQIARQNDQIAEMIVLLKKQSAPGTESNA